MSLSDANFTENCSAAVLQCGQQLHVVFKCRFALMKFINLSVNKQASFDLVNQVIFCLGPHIMQLQLAISIFKL